MAEPTPRSPEWWVERLNNQIDARRPQLDRWNAYYEGDHPLPEPPRWASNAKDAYRKWLKKSRSNWMALVIDAVAERLAVQGIRYGRDQAADEEAWRIWQANGLDLGAAQVHLEALINGESYVTVAPNPDDPSAPLVTPEHPTQMIVSASASTPRVREAAFKKWLDDSGYVFATLYLPGELYKLQSDRSMAKAPTGSKIRWEPREVDGEEFPATNPLGVVPVIPFRNRARMIGRGLSEIDGVTDSQDRINETLFDRLIAQKTSAFRQRYLTGFEPDRDDDGKAKKPFEPSSETLWWTANENARFGDFDQTDLSGYLEAVEADVQHIAAQTHTPPHYLLGEMINLAAEALKAAEAGLIAKVGNRMLGFGESWEQVHALAFRAAGDEQKASVVDAEIIWKNPEFRTEGQLVDALVKMETLGVPTEALWERWGASPQEIKRWKQMRTAQSLMDAGRDLDALLGDRQPTSNGDRPSVEVTSG